MDFNKKVLEDCIKEFKNNKIVFSNESQFQFELGVKLKEKGYKVLFEVLSVYEGKKIYTDLVLDLGNNKYIAIELKYKSAAQPQTKNAPKGYCNKIGAFCYNGKYVFPQGAEDEGSYFFLKDIERLKKFVSTKETFNFDKDKKVEKGYAIIIANSKAYWSKHDDVVWSDFSLEEGRTIKKDDELIWNKKSKKHSDWEPITLNSDYVLTWEDYYNNSSKTDFPIKYMIIEVKND